MTSERVRACGRAPVGRVAVFFLVLAGCICPMLGPGSEPPGMVRVGTAALPPGAFAIVRGDDTRVSARVASAADRTFAADGCTAVVTQKALFKRWPGYPRDVPVPSTGKYNPKPQLEKPLPEVARAVAKLTGTPYVVLVWAGSMSEVDEQTGAREYYLTLLTQVYARDGTLIAHAKQDAEAHTTGACCLPIPLEKAAPKIDEALDDYGAQLAHEVEHVLGPHCSPPEQGKPGA